VNFTLLNVDGLLVHMETLTGIQLEGEIVGKVLEVIGI
jgi:hypothetical protein